MQLRALWCFPLEVLLRQFGRIDAKESTIPAAMNFVPTGHFSHPRKWMKIWSLSLTGYFLCWLSGQRIRSFCEFWHHVSLQRDLLQCTALNNFSIRFPFEGFSHEPIKLYWEEHSFNDSLPALNYHSIFWVFFYNWLNVFLPHRIEKIRFSACSVHLYHKYRDRQMREILKPFSGVDTLLLNEM